MPDGRDVTVIFDGSFEGLLTIVHKRYYEKLQPDRIVNRDCFQHTLFTDYISVETDFDKADTVMNALVQKISAEAQQKAYMAFCAADEERYMSIFKYIVLGFTKGREVDNYMQLDYVLAVQNHAKFVGRESHLFKGFVRFKDIGGGLFFAEIEPVNNILTFLAEHFADRFAEQPWIIYDSRRKLAAVFDGKDYVIAEAKLDEEALTRRMSRNKPDNILNEPSLPDFLQEEPSPQEDNYQELWRNFVSHIAVEGRINKKLQTQLLPKRYRRFMTEFQIGKVLK